MSNNYTRWSVLVPDLTAEEAAALHYFIDLLREGDDDDEDSGNFERWTEAFGTVLYPEDFSGIQFVWTALPDTGPLSPDKSGLSVTIYSDESGSPSAAGDLIQRWLAQAGSDRIVIIIWVDYSDNNRPGSVDGGYGVVSAHPDASEWLTLTEAAWGDARDRVNYKRRRLKK